MVQQIVDQADILRMPDWNKTFYLWTDASEKAYGAVLMQQDENGQFVPIEFMSKLWNQNEENWPITTNELAAMIEAIKKWEKYLNYNKFIVHTDAKNIYWLMKKIENREKNGNPMHYRWIIK